MSAGLEFLLSIACLLFIHRELNALLADEKESAWLKRGLIALCVLGSAVWVATLVCQAIALL